MIMFPTHSDRLFSGRRGDGLCPLACGELGPLSCRCLSVLTPQILVWTNHIRHLKLSHTLQASLNAPSSLFVPTPWHITTPNSDFHSTAPAATDPTGTQDFRVSVRFNITNNSLSMSPQGSPAISDEILLEIIDRIDPKLGKDLVTAARICRVAQRTACRALWSSRTVDLRHIFSQLPGYLIQREISRPSRTTAPKQAVSRDLLYVYQPHEPRFILTAMASTHFGWRLGTSSILWVFHQIPYHPYSGLHRWHPRSSSQSSR